MWARMIQQVSDRRESMMRKLNLTTNLLVLVVVVALAAMAALPVSAGGFERYPVITLDGEEYYWEGSVDGPNGEKDIPRH